MRRPISATMLLVALAAPPAAAQAPELRLAGTGDPVSVAPALHRGFPAYPVSALRTLGARVSAEPDGPLVVLFGDTLRFQTFSPFLRSPAGVAQLAFPAYREGGVDYLPRGFFVDFLPARYPDRLAVDGGTLRLESEPAPRAAPAAKPAAARTASSSPARAGATSPTPAPTRSEPPAPSPSPSLKTTRVVVIDPGHGGRDPGKVGPNGVREKDVVLSVAHRLAGLLRERGFEVHLTRQRDTLIALDDRPRLANDWKAGRPAALFLSLHANAGPAHAHGFETYFLAEARTEDERRVAEMENAAVAYEEKSVEALAETDRILLSLRNDYYVRASNALAEVIQQRLAAFHPGPNRGVKQAGFRVLIGAVMPAVLVELAFVSNRDESRLLAASDFQQKAAWAIADAVGQFFSTHEHLWTAEGTW